jgi:hypothetical protein
MHRRRSGGSHLAMPRILTPAGGTGMSGDDPNSRVPASVLCHPFIVHTATWPHRGTAPRTIAQPGIHVEDGFAIDRSDPSPVARAIAAGLDAGSSGPSMVRGRRRGGPPYPTLTASGPSHTSRSRAARHPAAE